MRVALYCRVSTSEQDTLAQKETLEKYAKAKGWDYQTFVETESSRKTRPVKQRVLKMLRNRELDGVIIFRLDRWARSTVELLLEVKELVDKGIDFISISDNIDLSTASGKLHFTILSAFAEFERSLISARTKSALKAKKDSGIRLGRPPGSKDTKKRKKSGYYIREMKKREQAK